MDLVRNYDPFWGLYGCGGRVTFSAQMNRNIAAMSGVVGSARIAASGPVETVEERREKEREQAERRQKAIELQRNAAEAYRKAIENGQMPWGTPFLGDYDCWSAYDCWTRPMGGLRNL